MTLKHKIMGQLFVYGTLLDAKIRYRVLGRTIPAVSISPAVLDGYCRVFVAGRSYPMLLRQVNGRVPGLLLRNLSRKDCALLDAYEGDEYILSPVVVHCRGRRRVRAGTYLCHSQVKPFHRHWISRQGLLRSRIFCQ